MTVLRCGGDGGHRSRVGGFSSAADELAVMSTVALSAGVSRSFKELERVAYRSCETPFDESAVALWPFPARPGHRVRFSYEQVFF